MLSLLCRLLALSLTSLSLCTVWKNVLIFGVDFNSSSGFNFFLFVGCLGFCNGVRDFKDNIFLIFSVPVFLCLEGGDVGGGYFGGDLVWFGEIWELVGDLGINLVFLGVGVEILWEGGKF